jgi:DNA-binding response OmpR family regulator
MWQKQAPDAKVFTMAPIVAIVEDEQTIREAVAVALKREGYRTQSFRDGGTAWEVFQKTLPALAILDIVMPGMDGLDLCRNMRGISRQIPIVFLTSKDEEFDRVLGLELGADDYLCKPFSMRELMTRVKVLFRRMDAMAQSEPAQELGEGELRLDLARHTASWAGTPLVLTVTEFRILEALVRTPGHVKSRINLMELAYPHDAYVSDRTIDTHVKRIRKKLVAIDPDSDVVQTVYGVGYRLNPELG